MVVRTCKVLVLSPSQKITVWKLACGNFMLLQDFFAKATLLRVHKKFSTEVCSTVFLPPEIK